MTSQSTNGGDDFAELETDVFSLGDGSITDLTPDFSGDAKSKKMTEKPKKAGKAPARHFVSCPNCNNEFHIKGRLKRVMY